jgi:pimeloyl-ACP methyl ester carboxylesterase
LLAQPTLARGHQFITYHRRGYVNSSQAERVLSLAEQAADCRALLRHFGIERAHVVGHSFGGVVALQLALDTPEMVGTLALLEPALAVGASGPGYRQSLVSSSRRYREVGAALVVDETLRARWPGYRAHWKKCYREPSTRPWPMRPTFSSRSCRGCWTGASVRNRRVASLNQSCQCRDSSCVVRLAAARQGLHSPRRDSLPADGEATWYGRGPFSVLQEIPVNSLTPAQTGSRISTRQVAIRRE